MRYGHNNAETHKHFAQWTKKKKNVRPKWLKRYWQAMEKQKLEQNERKKKNDDGNAEENVINHMNMSVYVRTAQCTAEHWTSQRN